jgi:hypothetical protein
MDQQFKPLTRCYAKMPNALSDDYLTNHPKDHWALSMRKRWDEGTHPLQSKGGLGLSATGSGSPGGDVDSMIHVSVTDRTCAIVRGLELILDHHDAKEGIRSVILDQISTYLNTAQCEKIWVKRVKYLLARPLAQYLKCELPSVPDLEFEFRGSARRWVKNRIHAQNRKNVHLWYSWFQVKRCSLESSDLFIDDVYTEHLLSLTKPDPGDPFAIDAAFSNPTFEHVLKKVRKGLDRYINDLDHTSFTTTKSGCFEKSRALGGQHNQLRSICMDRTWPTVRTKGEQYYRDFVSFLSFTDELHSMKDFSRICDSDFLVVETRQPVGLDDWIDLASHIAKMTLDAPLRCKIQGVLEPLKVRVISKGEALPYFSQRALQKASPYRPSWVPPRPSPTLSLSSTSTRSTSHPACHSCLWAPRPRSPRMARSPSTTSQHGRRTSRLSQSYSSPAPFLTTPMCARRCASALPSSPTRTSSTRRSTSSPVRSPIRSRRAVAGCSLPPMCFGTT